MVGTNAPSAQAAQSVGGSRTAVSRRRISAKAASGSSATGTASRPRAHASQGGILKFYTEDAPGLRIGPQTVLILALVFMGSVVLLHIFGKIRESIGSN